MSNSRRRKNHVSTTKAKSANNIRLIGGKHRGRKLPVLNSDGLRPTTDRVKETLFNWLMVHINDSVCLDCYAGAGSLGFEAFSRGAQRVTMLELNKAAANQLTTNKTLLNAKNIEIVNTDTIKFLSHPTQLFNIIFIDPPFRQGLVQQTINLLAKGWLADDALIYIEAESELTTLTLPSSWQLLKEKTAGQVTYRLYQIT